MTPHPSPHLASDTDDAARSWARYRDGLERANRIVTELNAIEADRVERAMRRGPAPVTPPPATARDHVRMFVRSALAMGAVVVVLLALFWIGGGR